MLCTYRCIYSNYFFGLCPRVKATSVRFASSCCRIGADEDLEKLSMVGNVCFIWLPSFSAVTRLQKGCGMRFKMPIPLFLLILQLCVCWLQSSSQMAAIIQSWDLASRLLWNTLDGWRGLSPHGGFLSCAVEKPPHYCLLNCLHVDYTLYEKPVGWVPQ